MSLRTGQAGLDIRLAFEGRELVGYLCPARVPTIAEGFTGLPGVTIKYTDGSTSSKPIVGKKITRAESDRLTRLATDHFEDKVEALLKRPAESHQFDAMVLLAYNIGIGGFKGSTVLRKFNAGDLAGASRAFEAWNKATVTRNGKRVKVVVKGLVRRRAAEQALFDGDIERAYAIAQITRTLGMPQKVDAPKKAAKLADNGSVTGGTAIVGGTAVLGAMDKVGEADSALSTLSSLKDTALRFIDGLPLDSSTIFYLAALGVAGFLIYRGYQSWRDNEVDGDEHEQVDVPEEEEPEWSPA